MTGLRSELRVYFFTFFLIISYISTEVSQAGAVSFDYNFSDGNDTGIGYERDAFYNRTVINLTKNEKGDVGTYSVGRMLYNSPVLIWDSKTRELTNFVTEFSFIINYTVMTDPQTNTYILGDGLAFFLSNQSIFLSSYSGGGLGILPDETTLNAPKNKIIAIEIDTFDNTWDPPYDYVTNDHIGIDINTIRSNITEIFPKIVSGTKMTASINYNGTTQVLIALLGDDQNKSIASINTTVDLRTILPEEVFIGFSAATGYAAELHQILSWSFNSTLERKSSPETKSLQKKSVFPIVVVPIIGVGIFIILVAIIWVFVWRNRSRHENEENVRIDGVIQEGRGPQNFLHRKLVDATNNFAEDRKLGQGGFGSVYRGFLVDLSRDVAIKRVSKEKEEGKNAYITEVKIISRLRHRNLVQLVGWCHSGRDFLLVYELMPEGSLDAHLYNSDRILTWAMRQKIAVGLGSALNYLHNDWEQCVLHRDIKPSNVMLDLEFNAKLGDFGLARLIDHNCSQATLSGGTLPYLAPECFTLLRANKETDVYSFGIVLLEIACGRPPIKQDDNPGKIKLLNWVWNLFGGNNILEAADERLKGEYEEREMECMMVVGLWCAHPNFKHRPSMKEALSVLNFESSLPILPLKMPPMPEPDYEAFKVPPLPHLVELTSIASSATSRTTGIYSTSSTAPSSSSSSSVLLKHDHLV